MTNPAASGTSATTDSQPQRGTTTEPPSSASTTGNDTQQPTAGDDSVIRDPEKKRLHDEAIAHKKRAEAAERELKKFQDAQLSEQEKLQRDHDAAKAELTAAQRELTELRLSRAIERKAAALHIINPDVAARLLDWSEVEFDASGAPKNLDKLLTALIQAEPYLVANGANGQQTPPARPASSGGATNPGAGGVQPVAAGGSGATITRASYLAMSLQERIARSKEIDAVLVRNGGRLPD